MVFFITLYEVQILDHTFKKKITSDLYLWCSGVLNSVGEKICANELYHPGERKPKQSKTF